MFLNLFGTQVGKREAMYWAPLETAMKVSTQAIKKEWIEGRQIKFLQRKRSWERW